MTRPKGTTIGIWVTVIFGVLTIAGAASAVVYAAGGDQRQFMLQNRMVGIEMEKIELRVRKLESSESDIRVLQSQITSMDKKIDQMYQWIVPPSSRTRE